MSQIRLHDAIEAASDLTVGQALKGQSDVVIVGDGGQPRAVASLTELVHEPKQIRIVDTALARRPIMRATDNAPALEVVDFAREFQVPESGLVVVVDTAYSVQGFVSLRALDLQAHNPGAALRAALPGPIVIDLVIGCRFEEGQIHCGHWQEFDEMPPELPPCENPRGLSPHFFVW